MTVIADKDRETIREMLAGDLEGEVELALFTRPRSGIFVPGRQDCQTCDETRELLEELVGLSDKLSLVEHDAGAEPDVAAELGVREVPAIFVRRRGEAGTPVEAAVAAPGEAAVTGPAEAAAPVQTGGNNVRFTGLPAGYEFSTLLADIVDVSNGRTDLSEATREAVRAIDRPVHIQVFVTPT